jgi:glucosamine-6-phosphate deaminase
MTDVGESPGSASRHLVILPTGEDVAKYVARLLADAIRVQPAVCLGLATGGSMVPVYRRLVGLIRSQRLDTSFVTTFNLDEYVGLPGHHPQSYHAYMRQHLFEPGGFSASRTHIPDGMAEDLPAACEAYDADIRQAGGIELQLLGLGPNGHIGFNEPGTAAEALTHVVDLTQETRRANARFFRTGDTPVPHRAITMGLGTIMEARRIVVVVTGRAKAAILAHVLTGDPSSRYPATILRRHGHVLWCVDRSAASNLPPLEAHCTPSPP